MMLAFYTVILSGCAFAFSGLGTWALVRLLPQFALIDAPNERSNHAAPTPRGGGIAVTGTALFFLIAAAANHWTVYAVTLAALISFADDRKHVPPLRRLAVHAVAALMAVHMIEQPVFPMLSPLWAKLAAPLTAPSLHHFQHALPMMMDHVISAILLVYFVNLYNFMDGIDEITTAETVGIGVGLVAVVWAAVGAGLPGSLAIDGMIIAGAVAGFWLFNRHPAKIFLGDVGSVPLGLIAGALLLLLASQGCPAAALILPAYYLVDATTTLLFRLLRGKRFWEAHSEHAYQRAVRAGVPHDRVSRMVLGLNLILAALAAISTLPQAWAAPVTLLIAYGLAGALALGLRLRGAAGHG